VGEESDFLEEFWKTADIMLHRALTWWNHVGELKGALIVTPVIVKLLFGLGLVEIRFWVVRNGMAWGRL